MPFSYYWDSPAKEIIRIEITGDWTWQEYNDTVIALSEMTISVNHRVDYIADMRESGHPPTGNYSSQHIKRGREIRPKNYGITVNVGADILTKAIFNTGVITGESIRKPRYYVNTIEEAYDAIKKERQADISHPDKKTPQEENNQSPADGQ